MGYQALLFCPDEKTARTVTQVLSELEFNVEPCVETFAAVKKLMGTHFDAVVVDCDNEQNAALLFKSARNSTSNQTSLAVAVVEGQAGVAKAFRIGANLVLTKPINIEQAKGTLRVARGLLRKGEPPKAGAAATAPAPASTPLSTSAAKPVAAKPASAKPNAPLTVGATTPHPPASTPPASAWPTHTAAASPVLSSHDPSHDNDVPGNRVGEPGPPDMVPAAPPMPRPSVAPKIQAAKLPAPSLSVATAQAKLASKATSHANAVTVGSGAASAPAPARDTKNPDVAGVPPSRSAHVDALGDKHTGAQPVESNSMPELPVPSFTFGGNISENKDAGSSGSGKKILLIAAIVVIAAAVAYAGWAFYEGRTSQTVNSATKPAKQTLPATPTSTQPAPKPATSNAAPASPPATQAMAANNTETSSASTDSATDDEPRPAPAKSSPKFSTARAKSAPEAEPESAPLEVKGGRVPRSHPTADAADAPAPSMIGIAAAGASAPPPNVVTSEANAPTPVLQSVKISQGVSQGLLIRKVQPIYPRAALTMHIEGAVQLSVKISKTGDISNLKVLSGDARLAQAAVAAVKQWKYKPYLLDGEPVEIETTITLNFKTPN
jgi:periplasmic protein TonB